LTEQLETKQSRKTALTVAAVLGLLAAWNVHRSRPTVALVLAVVAGVLAAIGLLLPALAVRFHRAWMALAAVLGYVNSRILLSIIFFLVITPLGLVRKLCGADPLGRRGAAPDGYWIGRPVARQSKQQFERTF
jgi:hypothetical protein